MKREVSAPKGATIKAPEPPKSEIRQFGNAIEYMVDQMAQRWRTQIFSELNQDTVAKFADSVAIKDAKQSGNFAKVFLAMAARVQRKLLKQFDGKRLDKMTNKYTGKVNRRNQSEFYRRVSASVGISREELEATEGLTFQINAFQAETQQWVKKMRDDTLQMWTSNTLRQMAEGKGLPEILSQFDGMVEQRKGHAKMVARTQIATFNSLTSKARAQNLGITKARWVTSADERVRPSHSSRNGKEFVLSEGLYDSGDGKTLLPGTDYQCFPGSVKINHSSLCQKLYRRWYTGELTEIVRDDGVILRTTPNHPVFTVNGFKPAGLINAGENILCTVDKCVDGIELDSDNMIPTFEQFYSAVNLLGIEHGVAPASTGKFHGDVSDSNVDVISLDGFLMDEADAFVAQEFDKLELSESDKMIVLESLTCVGADDSSLHAFGDTPDRIVSTLNLVRSRLLVHFRPLELFRFALGSWANSGLEKPFSNGSPVSAKMFGDSVFAMSALVHGLNFFDRQIELAGAGLRSDNLDADLLKLPRKGGLVDPDLGSGELNGNAGLYKACRVVNKRTVNFSGHVYNLQTVSGDYIADTTAVSNCRCDYEMIIPEMEQ